MSSELNKVSKAYAIQKHATPCEDGAGNKPEEELCKLYIYNNTLLIVIMQSRLPTRKSQGDPNTVWC